MPQDRVLELSDVWDDSRRIRPFYTSRDNSDWVPHGRYSVRDVDGRLKMEITYSRGIVDGPYTDYWSNGQVASIGHFENGDQHGVWQFYGKDGALLEVINFDHGKETRSGDEP